MAQRAEEKMSNYTPAQRKELRREFNAVLRQCNDRQLGVAISAATHALRRDTGSR
jgi:hypothetical protein